MIDVRSEELLRLSDVARMLKVHLQTVRNWTNPQKRGNKMVLETVKFGSRIRTSKEALNRFQQPNTECEAKPIESRPESAARKLLRERHGI